MKKILEDPNIMNIERRTIKWFVSLFYIISLSYELLYDFVIPKFVPSLKDDSSNILGFWIYLVLFGLIPVATYLFKNNKQASIKYLYFITWLLLTLINDCISYFNHPALFKSGNIIELYWLLLSPIFINTQFFRLVAIGLIVKYGIDGVITHSPNVFEPIVLIGILSFISNILLNRFQSYVNALKTSHDNQLIGIVKGVIATLELKDPYTRGHSERVASYASILAKETGKFSDDELKEFYYACLLHDIGKVNISDEILMKPTSLTKEEYEIIKSHALVGAEAVSKVYGLDNCISVIRSHHERWDGKGYPDQLKRDEIPYLARVAAVADAFDAMTSTRSYRAALSLEEAYSRIIEGKGTQFDPELVPIFEKILPKWKIIHQEWKNKNESTNVKLPDVVNFY